MRPKLMTRMMWSYTIVLLTVLFIENTVGQSNYASHANNVDYLGKGLPEEATLDGKVSIHQIMEFSKSVMQKNVHTHTQIRYCWKGYEKKNIEKTNSSTASIARYFQLLSMVWPVFCIFLSLYFYYGFFKMLFSIHVYIVTFSTKLRHSVSRFKTSVCIEITC